MTYLTTTTMRQHGRGLIELLVSIAIGLVIMGSVLLISVSSVGTGDKQTAIARLNEDAAIASNILNAHLRVAGFSQTLAYIVPPVGSSGILPTRNYIGPPVRGCENGIGNLAALNYTQIACNGAPGADAFAVMYEATADNTLPSAAGLPTDCLGQGINAIEPSAIVGRPAYALAENRFYIDNDATTGNPTLYCRGNGGLTAASTSLGGAQPLIDNVVDMQVTYGVAGVPAPGANVPPQPFFEPVQYLDANQIAALPTFPVAGGNPLTNWERVVSMRICLLMRSDDNALDSVTPYFDCAGTQITPTDRRLYRTVNITAALKNRVPPCSDAVALPGSVRADPSRCF